MCLLCSFGVGHIVACLKILFAHRLEDLLLRCTQAECGEVHRVSTHIGDLSGLVKSLGNAHGLADGVVKLTSSFLLESRGSERWGRLAFDGFLLDVADGVGRFSCLFEECLGFFPGFESLRQFSIEEYSLLGLRVKGGKRAGYAI